MRRKWKKMVGRGDKTRGRSYSHGLMPSDSVPSEWLRVMVLHSAAIVRVFMMIGGRDLPPTKSTKSLGHLFSAITPEDYFHCTLQSWSIVSYTCVLKKARNFRPPNFPLVYYSVAVVHTCFLLPPPDLSCDVEYPRHPPSSVPPSPPHGELFGSQDLPLEGGAHGTIVTARVSLKPHPLAGRPHRHWNLEKLGIIPARCVSLSSSLLATTVSVCVSHTQSSGREEVSVVHKPPICLQEPPPPRLLLLLLLSLQLSRH